MDKTNINRGKLTLEQLSALEASENAHKQLQAITDLADMAQEIINLLDEQKKSGNKTTEGYSALLMDIRESLVALKIKEAPAIPDFAKPIVESVSGLEKALNTSLRAIDVRPVVKVSAPSVSLPEVDLSGVQAAVGQIPAAFKAAIKLIPKTEIPEADYGPITKLLEGLSEQLLSLENTTRLKPQPGVMKVTNPDASLINAGGTRATTTSVANSVTAITLLKSNPARKAVSIYNDDSAANLYLRYDAPATTSVFKIKIGPGGYYEFPLPVYTGLVSGIASAATGSARISEET